MLLNLSSLAEAELGAALAASATPGHAANIGPKNAENAEDDADDEAYEGTLPAVISALPSASVATTLGALMPLFKVISATSRRDLGRISTASRRDLGD